MVTSLIDVRYLTGFTGSSAVLVLVGGKATMFTDGRYRTQAAAEVDGAQVVSRGAQCAERGGGVRGQGGGEPVRVRLWPGDSGGAGGDARAGLEQKLRKDLLRGRAGRGGEAARGEGRNWSRTRCARQRRWAAGFSTGCSSTLCRVRPRWKLRWRSSTWRGSRGAEGMSFRIDCGCGCEERAAARACDPTRSWGGCGCFVLLDFGVLLGGYCSDMTRTVAPGCRADGGAAGVRGGAGGAGGGGGCGARGR